jgi:GDPmannose 4,6-dehydratase
VEHDPALLRPAEILSLRGDATRAREALGWKLEVDFDSLVERMVRHDVDRLAG